MLREYLEKNHLTIDQFSKIIDYAPQYLSNCMNGHQGPGKKLRRAVCTITNGHVGNDEWPLERISYTNDTKLVIRRIEK